ncbi:MAG: heavy metal translocating P-type ATPase metal-binding domain-containing protein [Verrucomicrobia bacterium]|nr:heavy metal translocating P-type ATPase metal-binding domain-containing protein [Verrucomicrobiota bacterium]
MQRSLPENVSSHTETGGTLAPESIFRPGSPSSSGEQQCFHCGTPARNASFRKENKAFCCNGCLTVFELLTENGLTDFYQLADNAGVRVKASTKQDQFLFLDEPTVRERLVNFSNGKITRVSFRIPAIHCIACVWLLENLFRLKPGIGQSQVNFPLKEISISFEDDAVKLSEVVALLASLGYEPDLKLSDLESPKDNRVSRRLWLQLGVAGFAFGNIMLFSISNYLGLDTEQFQTLFGYLSFVLALPVVFYSAADYWKAAWIGLRRKLLTIEVPIAAGIVAIFGQSTYEVFTGTGEGYFDSLAGLLFFLNCGRLFQHKTYERLVFDRDYKSFFPLSVMRKEGTGEQSVSLSRLQVGDRLVIRNGELIPADAKLLSGAALIDYSFVTGEAEPSAKKSGEHLYAGGRQVGESIEVETVKAVSQSYLTSLWNQEAFQKEKKESLHTLINVFSYRFTRLVFLIATAAAVFWMFSDSSIALKAFISVLIVACPCALALAAPFSLGAAHRFLARRNVFLKNPGIIETLANVNTIVFDKTGTLTAVGAGLVSFQGAPLTNEEECTIFSLTRQSTHPHSVRISETMSHQVSDPVRSFAEKTGCGIEGLVSGREMWMGSAAWLGSRGVIIPDVGNNGSVVHLAVDGVYRGCFTLTSALRPETGQLLKQLSARYELALLSGDNELQRAQFNQLFANPEQLHFNQSPQKKFDFVGDLRDSKKTVMMVGDGLNDAGALKQSDVGVAVVENISAFSPASDVIMNASMVPRLDQILEFSKATVRVVRWSFIISTVYNVVGIGIAASGMLAPVVCAILMPLSSVTVIAFASGATAWMGRRIFDVAQVPTFAPMRISNPGNRERRQSDLPIGAAKEAA